MEVAPFSVTTTFPREWEGNKVTLANKMELVNKALALENEFLETVRVFYMFYLRYIVSLLLQLEISYGSNLHVGTDYYGYPHL